VGGQEELCCWNVKVSNMVHVEIAIIDVHLSKPTRLESTVAFRNPKEGEGKEACVKRDHQSCNNRVLARSNLRDPMSKTSHACLCLALF
jgi:hypothetical protein